MFVFGQILTACIFILITAGGLVTSTGSGLSVPDWPLSYGQFFPPMVGGVRYEHSHRVIAGFVGLLTAAYFFASLKFDSRKWFKVFTGGALLAVIVQAVLGGLTVIYLLPTPISVFHACLAQAFFSAILLSTFFNSKEWKAGATLHSDHAASLKKIVSVTVFFTFLQLVLGAVVRHTGEKQVGLHFHMTVGALVVLHIWLSAFKIAKDPQAKPFLGQAFINIMLVVIQLVLGIAAWLITEKKELADQMAIEFIALRTAHQTNGAVLLASTALLVARIHRAFRAKVSS